MRLSNKQKMLLHTAAKEGGCPGDEGRRLVQWNVGGFYSAAEPTVSREGFIAVMAFWEARAGGKLPHFTPRYWAGQDASANPLDEIRFTLRRKARALGMSDSRLDAFIAGEHMSSGVCRDVNAANAYWLRRTVIAIDAIIKRKEAAGRRSAASARGVVGDSTLAAADSPPTASPA